jgi:hypothetical protein
MRATAPNSSLGCLRALHRWVARYGARWRDRSAGRARITHTDQLTEMMRQRRARSSPIFAFDHLHLDGHDLRAFRDHPALARPAAEPKIRAAAKHGKDGSLSQEAPQGSKAGTRCGQTSNGGRSESGALAAAILRAAERLGQKVFGVI